MAVCETQGMEVNEMDWQVVEKMRVKEDLIETTKGKMKRDGAEENETEEPREDQTSSTPKTNEEVIGKEGTPNGVALSNHRFDPFPIFPCSFSAF